ncbi:MAG: glycosyltransferase family 2 protein [Synechococcales bacterium]|nr:glycosyltransferase family 2 protein [Synechococcales bacterium]
MDCPRISVVIPSFNQAQFLEDTLLSVINQGYPNTEIIVIDGGSTDGSVDIIRRYEAHLAYWVSEPDGGQTRGLIKGFQRATGSIQCWLNSDDLHESKTLAEVAAYFQTHPDVDAVYGNTTWIDPQGQVLREQREIPFNRFIWMYTYNYIPGMSMFWRDRIYQAVGGLDPTFDLAMDADLWIRFADHGRIEHVPQPWSKMRFYPEQKNRRLRAASDREDLQIRERYWQPQPVHLYTVKRWVAQSCRILWRVWGGCYLPGYVRDMSKLSV